MNFDFMSDHEQKLQLALAKILPEKVDCPSYELIEQHLDKRLLYFWKDTKKWILETEMLHICWLIEQGMTVLEQDALCVALCELVIKQTSWCNFLAIHASWQQRAKAICKVKGVDV